MSYSSFTASERRGIILIAIITLLIIASGIVLGLCGRNKNIVEDIPVVVEHSQMVDSVKNGKPDEKGIKNKKKKSTSSSKNKSKKEYRRRSPHDEPV